MPVQLARPERFSGDSGDCCSFLTQCELHFELQAQMLQSERAKIAYLISHLTGIAEAWVMVEWARRSLFSFREVFTQIFQIFSPGHKTAHSLLSLCQGHRSVLDYTIEFCTLAADSGWNNSALVDAYLNGLSAIVKDQLVSLDILEELDRVVALTNKIDRRLRDHEREAAHAPIQTSLLLTCHSGETSRCPSRFLLSTQENPVKAQAHQ